MDANEFKEIILARYEAMYRVAYAIVQDRDDAQDAVQEAVTRLWARRDELSGVESPEGLCSTVVRNICVDTLRRRLRHSPVDDTLPDAPDSAPGVDERLEAADTLAHASALLATLPVQQQDVVRLRSQGDCSIDEIAAITGHSAANVRQLLSRARRSLRRLMGGQDIK